MEARARIASEVRRDWRLALPIVVALLAIVLLGWPAPASAPGHGSTLGVASCAGTTCHGRQEADGKIVRQDELAIWQNEASPAGAHSRAWRVLGGARGRSIAARLGIGNPQASASCVGCHADPDGGLKADGVGCEACHGGAGNWIAAHAAVGTSHARNVSLGMVPLDNAQARAETCLNCHFGSSRPGQFVDHRLMAAGHPRISFELDLFSTLEQHWNEDGDYAQRKGQVSNVRVWAVGQARALVRALTLYGGSKGQAGVYPEFYFLDCHSCHRRISDDEDFRPSALANPGRPVPPGMPPFQDENMIMLSAAARVAAPAQAARFDADARAFHAAFAAGRPQTIAAAARLRGSAEALAAAFMTRPFGRAETLGIMRAVAVGAAERYTDYEASAQAVMAVDTLLAALVKQGAIAPGAAAGIREQVNAAYRAVKDPNGYRPLEFRAAISRAASAIAGVA